MHQPGSLSSRLLDWYHTVKRDLPWRKTKDPYRIWISEIMLQQTRVESVKGYYERFLQLFPTVFALAAAPEEQVLKAWQGLGYYSRARNLHKAAQTIVYDLNGQFPQTYGEILKLSGIGAYTAGAIASIAFDVRVPAIDGNVHRVAARFFGIREDIGSPEVQKLLRERITGILPAENVGDFNQALMELGATVCVPRTPKCELCPWQSDCDAYAEQDVEMLPIHEKKRPPKAVDVAVCLLTFENRILVTRRPQRMLQGMYVFTLIEEETDVQRIHTLLSENGFSCAFVSHLGSARHIFTHRIWEMQILHFALTAAPQTTALHLLNSNLVDRQALDALPFPTAMCIAREKAMALISK